MAHICHVSKKDVFNALILLRKVEINKYIIMDVGNIYSSSILRNLALANCLAKIGLRMVGEDYLLLALKQRRCFGDSSRIP